MNLFENILNPKARQAFSQTGNAIWQAFKPLTQFWQQATQWAWNVATWFTKPIQSTVQWIGQQVQKWVTQKKIEQMFSDEKQAYDKMKVDWIDDSTAFNVLKQRRDNIKQVVWLAQWLTEDEAKAMQKMKAEWVDAIKAAWMLKQYQSQFKDRETQLFEDKYKKWNLAQKWAYNLLAWSAWNLETVLKYWGNILDFATFWLAWFGEEVKKMEEVTQSPEFQSSTAYKVGTYLPDVATAVSPIWAWYLAWAKWVWSLALRSWAVWAWFWATSPIMEKGSEATIWDIATGGAIGWAIWWAIPLIWTALSKWIKKWWKILYNTAIKPNVQEAEQIITSEAKTFANKQAIKKINSSKLSPTTKAKKIASLKWETPVLRSDTALKYGIAWTEKQIWVKWKWESMKLWRDKVSPAISKSKAEHNIDDMFKKAEEVISKEKSSLRRQELMDWLEALRDDFTKTGKVKFTTWDLQAEKSMLDEFTPTKVWKGKEVAQGYAQVKNTMANIFRNQVREDLWKIWWETAKRVYSDYANLSALENIWVKWITEWWLKWWFGTFWSTVYDKIATPVKTVWWKYTYKLWNWIEYVWPKWVNTLGKYLKSKGYKIVGDKIINLSKNVTPITIRGASISSDTSTWDN